MERITAEYNDGPCEFGSIDHAFDYFSRNGVFTASAVVKNGEVSILKIYQDLVFDISPNDLEETDIFDDLPDGLYHLSGVVVIIDEILSLDPYPATSSVISFPMLRAEKIGDPVIEIGDTIFVGKKASEFCGYPSGTILNIVEGTDEVWNGLFHDTVNYVSVWDESSKEYIHITDIFGEDYEYFMDSKITSGKNINP